MNNEKAHEEMQFLKNEHKEKMKEKNENEYKEQENVWPKKFFKWNFS